MRSPERETVLPRKDEAGLNQSMPDFGVSSERSRAVNVTNVATTRGMLNRRTTPRTPCRRRRRAARRSWRSAPAAAPGSGAEGRQRARPVRRPRNRWISSNSRDCDSPTRSSYSTVKRRVARRRWRRRALLPSRFGRTSRGTPACVITKTRLLLRRTPAAPPFCVLSRDMRPRRVDGRGNRTRDERTRGRRKTPVFDPAPGRLGDAGRR